jgi:hypothetical protein
MRIREVLTLTEGKILQIQIFNKNVRVYANPSRTQFLAGLKMHTELRGLIDEAGNQYYWDAMEATHSPMSQGLHIYGEVAIIIVTPDKDGDIQCEWIPLGDHDWAIKDVPNFLRITKGFRITGRKSVGYAKFEFDNR